MKQYAVISSKLTGAQQVVIMPSAVQEVLPGSERIQIVLTDGDKITLQPKWEERHTALREVLSSIFEPDELAKVIALNGVCSRYLNPSMVRAVDFKGGFVRLSVGDGRGVALNRAKTFADFQQFTRLFFGEAASSELVAWAK